ncbi:MAG: tetratricopeptide repeat protein [candidate division Zixibacteria bacterium]|nr:tetratricopeptide repeat protein [candidate division Zixibacteria bacterium]
MVLLAVLPVGCVYYNTFYNAKKAFNDAERTRKENRYGKPKINQAKYKKAIEKSLKVTENYPNSKYYDDALFVLGVSYFWTKQYDRAERRFREIIANYEEFEYFRDSRLYLARTELEQGEIESAMESFVELLNEDVSRSFKGEAAMALGLFHFEERLFSEAHGYFLLIRDSLGSDEERIMAQRHIADGYFESFQFDDAQGAYLQILGMDPSLDERFHALYRAASCSYRMLRIDEGLDYLETLMDDEKYYDSLNVLRLALAEGYEWDGDIEQAEMTYYQVSSSEDKNKVLRQEALYNLGLIYQYEYDNLEEAKAFYDEALKLGRSSDAGMGALNRSSSIGKLEEYARTIEIDSATTQQAIDDAALTQFQLAELLWFDLNKPDTAILEMRYLVDSFPMAYVAPKGLISLSQMIREHEADSVAADSVLRIIIERYANSDYMPDALEALGLTGTAADTGHAAAYLRMAERCVVDDVNIDSARIYYQTIVDHFEDSQYYLLARFALIWLTETYDSPGDSSVYFSYTEFADSFPGTEWSIEATKRTNYRPAREVPQMNETGDSVRIGDKDFIEGEVWQGDSLVGYVDPERMKYFDPDGGMARDFMERVKIKEVREKFVYPTEAYGSQWQGDLVFQIKLDFSGEVVNLVQKTWSDVDEINIRAEETVRSTVWDTQLIPPEMLNSWWVYKLRITLPSHLK